jgi:hypothetical protein
LTICRQRLVEFVRQGGRHLAHVAYPANVGQLGLVLFCLLFGQPLLGRVLPVETKFTTLPCLSFSGVIVFSS